ILLIGGYRAFGVGSLVCMAGPLLVCARAVRASIENHSMARQLQAVEAIGRVCSGSVDAQKPLQRFLSLARDLIAFDRAALWLVDDSPSGAVARSVYPGGSPLPAAAEAGPESLIARAMQRSTPIVVSDSRRDPRLPES